MSEVWRVSSVMDLPGHLERYHPHSSTRSACVVLDVISRGEERASLRIGFRVLCGGIVEIGVVGICGKAGSRRA